MILTVINQNHINVIKWVLIELSIRSCSHEPSVYQVTTGVVIICLNLCSEPSVYRVTTGIMNLCLNLCSEPSVYQFTTGIMNLCLNLCSVNQITTGVVKFCNIAKDIEGITTGVSFKFNFLCSCSCHACDSELFTYFLLCDFYSTINMVSHDHDMLFLMAYSKRHIAQRAAHTVV